MTARPEAPFRTAFLPAGAEGPLSPLFPLAVFVVLTVAAAVARRRSWPVSFRRAILFFLLLAALSAAGTLLPPELLAAARPGLLAASQVLAWLGVIECAQGVLFDLLFGAALGRAPVPRILREFLSAALGLLVLFLALRGTLGVNLTSLLATSAMLSVVLGLALQETLGSFFSGLALQMEKPFAIGDWVQVGEHRGRVAQNGWRAVRIVTLEGDEVTLPNAAVARSVLVNFSRPTREHLHFVSVRAPLSQPPQRVMAALVEAARAVPGVLDEPPPTAILWEYGDSEVVYRARFWIQDFRRVNLITSDVAARIWYRLGREGVEFPHPSRVLRRAPAAPDRDAVRARIAEVLAAVDIFSPLGAGERALLAGTLAPERYGPGETLIRQGEPGDSLFVLTSGEVEVRVAGGAGEGVVGRLGPGSFFGEMSLLTGEPRAATVAAIDEVEVFRVTKESFRRVAAGNPGVLESVARIVAGRRAHLAETIRETGEAAAARAGHADLLARVRSFFGL